MSIVYGALGALFVLALFAGGFVTGWKVRAKFYRAKVESPAEAELKKIQEEQDAFRLLQNYNSDMAYGIHAVKDELEGSETA